MSDKIGLACCLCKKINYYKFKTTKGRLKLKKYCKNCKTSLLHLEER